jgi:c-di-GMP-binding flagellar brake protein YcgR
MYSFCVRLVFKFVNKHQEDRLHSVIVQTTAPSTLWYVQYRESSRLVVSGGGMVLLLKFACSVV